MKCLTNIQKKKHNSKGKEQPFKIRAKRTEEDETVYKKHWVQLVNNYISDSIKTGEWC